MSLKDDIKSDKDIFFDTEEFADTVTLDDESDAFSEDFICQFREGVSRENNPSDSIERAEVFFDEDRLTNKWKINDFITKDNRKWRIDKLLHKNFGLVTLQLISDERATFR